MIMILIEKQYRGTALLLLVNPHIPHRNNDTVCPIYILIVWKEDTSLPAVLNPLCSSTNQQLFKKNFCTIKLATMKITDDFHYEWKPSHAYHTFWGVKMNGTQRKALVCPLRMYCMYNGVAKGTSQAEATLNSEKYQACSLSHCWVTQVWRHQAVSYSTVLLQLDKHVYLNCNIFCMCNSCGVILCQLQAELHYKYSVCVYISDTSTVYTQCACTVVNAFVLLHTYVHTLRLVHYVTTQLATS